jgi:outer membrane protein insertion porin family
LAVHSFIPFPARPFRDSLLQAVKGPSVAAGVGLVYRFDPVRVEINFGVPLVAYKSDECQRGFQVGVGLEFL